MGVVTIDDRPLGPGRFPGSEVRFILDEDSGSGAVTLGEAIFAPGATVALHRHRVEEAIYIVEGNGAALVGETEIPVKPGDALLASAGELHGLRNNSSEPMKIVFFYPNVHVWAEYPHEQKPELAASESS